MKLNRTQEVSERKHQENSAVVSALINMICPDCGGPTLDFRCRGACCRDWTSTWGLLRRSDGRGQTPTVEPVKQRKSN